MSKQDVVKTIIKELAVIQPNVPVEKIAAIVSDATMDWIDTIEMKLTEMIRDWEDRMPQDDTFYSLGLRRALDVVKGNDPDLPDLVPTQ
jgi:hypothetical protein